MSFFDFLAEKLADAMIALGIFIVNFCRNHKIIAGLTGLIILILIDIAVFRRFIS